MGLLTIEDRTAFFCIPGESKKNVIEVTPDDIEKALELLVSDASIEIDNKEDSEMIANPAQKIMFEQLRGGFMEVKDSAPALKEEIDKIFAGAEKKYFG